MAHYTRMQESKSHADTPELPELEVTPRPDQCIPPSAFINVPIWDVGGINCKRKPLLQPIIVRSLSIRLDAKPYFRCLAFIHKKEVCRLPALEVILPRSVQVSPSWESFRPLPIGVLSSAKDEPRLIKVLLSLPGAVCMYALALGISNVGETLPRAVYALLSGLNSATVGIVALAAVQLSEKAITDPITRVLVFLSAAAGLMYNALWYFPLLMILAGLAAVVHDFRWLYGPMKKISYLGKKLGRASRRRNVAVEEGHQQGQGVELRHRRECNAERVSSSRPSAENRPGNANNHNHDDDLNPLTAESERCVVPSSYRLAVNWKSGLLIIILFLLTVIAINYGPSRHFAKPDTAPLRSLCEYVSRRNYYLWWRACCYPAAARVYRR